jgi:hypothetical protein
MPAPWLPRSQDDGEAYVRAARNGDLATLRALGELGCPRTRATFSRAVAKGARLPALRLLREELGWAVDWRQAMRAALGLPPYQRDAALLLWLDATQREATAAGREQAANSVLGMWGSVLSPLAVVLRWAGGVAAQGRV